MKGVIVILVEREVKQRNLHIKISDSEVSNKFSEIYLTLNYVISIFCFQRLAEQYLPVVVVAAVHDDQLDLVKV